MNLYNINSLTTIAIIGKRHQREQEKGPRDTSLNNAYNDSH